MLTIMRWSAVFLVAAVIVVYSWMSINIDRDVVGPVGAVLSCHTAEEAAWYLNKAQDRLVERGWISEADQLGELIARLEEPVSDPGAKEFTLNRVRSEVKNLMEWENEDSPATISVTGLIEKHRSGLWLSIAFWLLVGACGLTFVRSHESLYQNTSPQSRRPFSYYIQPS